jgi:hypothetical protein
VVALTADAATSARIAAHADVVRRHLESRNYVECGHTRWSTIPWLCRQFAGRLRIVHLSRPAPTALSWLTHQVYQQPLLPHLSERVLLSPFDDGVAFAEYRERWATLTPFEKCLYYWAEVHTFGLTQRDRLGTPWLHLALPGPLRRAGDHSLACVSWASNRRGVPLDDIDRIDRFRYAMIEWPDVHLVSSHSRVLKVAGALGYDASDIDAALLRRRYLRAPI